MHKKQINKANLPPRPELPVVDSGEKFGLLTSDHAIFETKKEELDDDLLDLTTHDSNNVDQILQELNIDPTLLLIPQHSASTAGNASQPVEAHSEPQLAAIVS